jgi:co-chaperonin GroES (HSP10)
MKKQVTCLGYRVLVEPVESDITLDTKFWIPEESRQKFKVFRVVQLGVNWGHGIYKGKRYPMEIKAGDRVLVDTSKGFQDMPFGKIKMRLVSYHDVVARLE